MKTNNEYAAKITEDLRKCGLRKGDSILVHSSLKSFGYIPGGAETVIQGLLQAVGSEGTVMMPTLTGSEKLSPDHPPRFDARNTPCWTGLIPETFRKSPSTRRSLHPTHSVSCLGPDSEAFISDHHECPTPCGKESPYYRLADKGGKIVLSGVGFDKATLFHTIEELAGVPYHLQKNPVKAEIINENGEILERNLYIHKYGDERNFPVMKPLIERAGGLRKGKVLKSDTLIVNASMLMEMTLAKLKDDPHLLLAKPHQ